ncbi:MAG: DUF6314 family protein [Aestuariivita sp.]|nr:DUF6314 family protein [Aestuariivita sp.]
MLQCSKNFDIRQLKDFLGEWQLNRQIIESKRVVGSFQGVASFDLLERGLVEYFENGLFTFQHQGPFNASQKYHWDEELKVSFCDGRYFHHIPPMGGAAFFSCPPDEYKGDYDFRHWPNWRVSWSVRGPCKAYNLISIYAR